MEKIRKYIGKIGKGIATAALAGYIALGSIGQVKAASSTEILSGHQSTTIDTKVIGGVTPKIGFLARNRMIADYKGNVNSFLIVDVTYALGNGFDAVLETQASPQIGVVPRPGLQYFKKNGDFGIFALSTTNAEKNPDLELISLLTYTPNLKENVNLLAQLETVTNIGTEGHNFSIQRARAGLDVKGYKFGVAADFFESGKTIDYNLGMFVKKDL